MLVTITEYRDLAKDGNGSVLPLGGSRSGKQSRTSVGAFAALADDTQFIRIATDTAITLDVDSSSIDELYPANSVEFLAVSGGEVLTIAAVA